MRLCILAVGIMMICVIFIDTKAAEESRYDESGNYQYVMNQDNTVTIIRYVGQGKNELKIPETIAGKNVTAIADSTFASNEELGSITIPASIISIGRRAFCEILNLKRINVSVDNPVYAEIDGVLFEKKTRKLMVYPRAKAGSDYTVPEGIESIDEEAFYKNENLKNIIIPDTVKMIGARAFYHSQDLESITLPAGLTSIEEYTFYECGKLQNIEIPRNVTKIGDYAFSKCGSLYQVMGSFKADIGEEAFSECFRLKYIEFSPGITTIGAKAFYWCYSLENVTIGESVTSIGENAFSAAVRQRFRVAEENTVYEERERSLFEKETKTLLGYPGSKASFEYAIPEGTEIIGSYAFAENHSLKTIKIPDSVTTIKQGAFEGCTELTELEIPESVIKIETRAFENCVSLRNITLPDGITSIKSATFHNCQDLTLTIPDSVTDIQPDAFSDCKNLKLIVEPDSYAKQWAKEKNYQYEYANTNDWLTSGMTEETETEDWLTAGMTEETETDDWLTAGITDETDVHELSNPFDEGTDPSKWYCWERAYEVTGLKLPGGESEAGWLQQLQDAGYEVGETPQRNSIAIWENDGTEVAAAFVEEVSGDSIEISESNWDESGKYGEVKTLEVDQMKNRMYVWWDVVLRGYIYLEKGENQSSDDNNVVRDTDHLSIYEPNTENKTAKLDAQDSEWESENVKRAWAEEAEASEDEPEVSQDETTSMYGYVLKVNDILYYMRFLEESLDETSTTTFKILENAECELVKRMPDGTESVVDRIAGDQQIGVLGDRIVYSKVEAGSSKLYGLDAEGNNPVVLDSGVLAGANGRMIAYYSQSEGGVSGLYAMNQNGTKVQLHSNYLGISGNLIYTQDNNWVTFGQTHNGQMQVFETNMSNGSEQLITTIEEIPGDEATAGSVLSEFMIDGEYTYYDVVQRVGSQGLYGSGKIFRVKRGTNLQELLVNNNATAQFQLMKEDEKTYLLYGKESGNFMDITVMNADTEEIVFNRQQMLMKTEMTDWNESGIQAYIDKSGVPYTVLTTEELKQFGFEAGRSYGNKMASKVSVQEDGFYVYLCRRINTEPAESQFPNFVIDSITLVKKDFDNQVSVIYKS